jgi:hypothetical protein
MKTKSDLTAMTASRFSALVNVDRNEILKRLEDAKAVPVGRRNGGELFQLGDLFRAAIGGDIAEQRLRKLRGEADVIEHSLALKRGEVVAVAEVERAVLWFFTKIRTVILASPLDRREQDAILMSLVNLRDDWNREAPNL